MFPARVITQDFNEVIIRGAQTSICDPLSATSKDATGAASCRGFVKYVRVASFTVGLSYQLLVAA